MAGHPRVVIHETIKEALVPLKSIASIVSSLLVTVGVNGNTVHAIPHDRLRAILKTYNRLGAP